MRTRRFENLFLTKVTLTLVAVPLMACDWLPQPCPTDLLNTAENRAKIFGCTCPPVLKANPEHLCCIDAGTCSEGSGLPDPETSDPAGRLSVALVDLRTAPDDELTRACDGGVAQFEVAWEWHNLSHGAVGDWTEYTPSEPQLLIDLSDLAGGPPVQAHSAGWGSMDQGAIEQRVQPIEVIAGLYTASIFPLPEGVQNLVAGTQRNVEDLQPGEPWYNTVCVGSGGSGG